MKKIILTILILTSGLSAYASDKDALSFFNSYIKASNTYSAELLNMYSSNAKIIRQVVKPNGEQVNIPFSVKDYKKQMIISSKLAKLRNYKNYYSDIDITKVSNGYKVTAKRKPSTSNYKLKSYMIVQEQPNGKWLIVEEMMQTKEQILLKYAK